MMTSDALDRRMRALEDEFFHRVDLKLMQKLHDDRVQEEKREQLKQLMQVTDEAILDELLAQGIDDKSVAVLLVVPLAYIAWADGHVTDSEHKMVFTIASEYATPGSDAWAKIVREWLRHEPSEKLWDAWHAYIEVLRERSPRLVSELLAETLLEHARCVAEVSDSFLSFRRHNSEKQAALEKLQDALKTPQ
jgi:hypothetical protein